MKILFSMPIRKGRTRQHSTQIIQGEEPSVKQIQDDQRQMKGRPINNFTKIISNVEKAEAKISNFVQTNVVQLIAILFKLEK